ncbi:hypothetical protein PAPYR_13414 [Paratrimastix pyriformis]|uniref:Secreted protein n=1 Tax=Paratrimastix pyriformis TaxID=342808 RepID=A0ABQ8U1T0_9EUKA|nr:hypothetical protein PAPYR_13414 [Paratrimastix pyriformis]
MRMGCVALGRRLEAVLLGALMRTLISLALGRVGRRRGGFSFDVLALPRLPRRLLALLRLADITLGMLLRLADITLLVDIAPEMLLQPAERVEEQRGVGVDIPRMHIAVLTPGRVRPVASRWVSMIASSSVAREGAPGG